MNIKGKIFGAAKDLITKKINEEGFLDNTINSTLEKLAELDSAKEKGIKMAKEYKKKEGKYYLYFKAPSYSMKDVMKMIQKEEIKEKNYKYKYEIYDESGNIKYYATLDFTGVMDRTVYTLYNSEREEVGNVKKHLVSSGVPLLEKDRKSCSVISNKELICKIQKSKTFNELDFQAYEGEIKMIYEDKEKKFKIEKKKEIIAEITQVFQKLGNELEDKYIIEYENEQDEALVVLISMAIDVINC